MTPINPITPDTLRVGNRYKAHFVSAPRSYLVVEVLRWTRDPDPDEAMFPHGLCPEIEVIDEVGEYKWGIGYREILAPYRWRVTNGAPRPVFHFEALEPTVWFEVCEVVEGQGEP